MSYVQFVTVCDSHEPSLEKNFDHQHVPDLSQLADGPHPGLELSRGIVSLGSIE